MAAVESLIVGSEKLITIFGYWPSFHDAEIVELNFWRGDVQPEKGIYDFPVLTLKVHLWELTTKTDREGYLITRYHTFTILRFYDVDDFQMEGFNHQNAIMELILRSEERNEGPSPYFAVKIEPAFGMGASFKCLRIEVSAAVPCSDQGIAICDDAKKE
ncbi:MAG: Imm50 family immunity protein [Terriglobales bacterium]